MVVWDGQETDAVPYGDEPHDKIIARMQRLCAAIPDDVELGLHLCYGDFAGKHFVEPKDAAAMVDFANMLSQSIRHKLAYIHMPVPIDRSDDAFHQPFRDLKLAEGHRAVSRRRSRQGRRRRHQGPDCGGAALCAAVRHRHRMRHGARAIGRNGAHASEYPRCVLRLTR